VWNINIKNFHHKRLKQANQCRPMKTLPAARLPNRTRPGQLAAVVRLHNWTRPLRYSTTIVRLHVWTRLSDTTLKSREEIVRLHVWTRLQTAFAHWPHYPTSSSITNSISLQFVSDCLSHTSQRLSKTLLLRFLEIHLQFFLILNKFPLQLSLQLRC
jgi:hypothetical protein